jgi:hypothetical protein
MKKTSHLDYLGHSETKDNLMVNYGSIMVKISIIKKILLS